MNNPYLIHIDFYNDLKKNGITKTKQLMDSSFNETYDLSPELKERVESLRLLLWQDLKQPDDICHQVWDIFQEWLKTISPKYRDICQIYFNFPGYYNIKRFSDIAENYNISKERVRQVVSEQIKIFYSILKWGIIKGSAVPWSISSSFELAEYYLLDKNYWNEINLFEFLGSRDYNEVYFLMYLLKFRVYKNKYITIFYSSKQKPYIAREIETLYSYFLNNLKWSAVDEVSSKTGVDPSLVYAISIVNDRLNTKYFIKEDGEKITKIRVNPCHTKRITDSTYITLFDAGRPLLRDEIKSQLPLRYKHLSLSDITVRLSADTRISPIGRSGKWALKEWGIDSRSKSKIMTDYLLDQTDFEAPESDVIKHIEKVRGDEDISPDRIGYLIHANKDIGYFNKGGVRYLYNKKFRNKSSLY